MDINDMTERWHPGLNYAGIVAQMQKTTKCGATRAQQNSRDAARRRPTEIGLRERLHAARAQQERTETKRQLWTACRQIGTERQGLRLTQVLGDPGKGGWGKQNTIAAPQGSGATGKRRQNGGRRLTRDEDVSTQATMYSVALLSPQVSDDTEETGYACNLNQLRQAQYDLWEYTVLVSADMVYATAELPQQQDHKPRPSHAGAVDAGHADQSSGGGGVGVDHEQEVLKSGNAGYEAEPTGGSRCPTAHNGSVGPRDDERIVRPPRRARRVHE